MKRSACSGSTSGITVVCQVLVLLDESRSGVAELTEAELESVVPTAGAVTEMTMVGEVAPAARLARVQVTVVVPLQAQPLAVVLTKLTVGGSESLTLTAEAAAGPALLTLRV